VGGLTKCPLLAELALNQLNPARGHRGLEGRLSSP
jgi:hypothetical protein